MRIARGVVLACVVFTSAPALAQYHGYQNDFVGWSADGTWYVMTTSGTDEMFVPVLCLSKRGGQPGPSWPKKVPVPAADDQDGCTERWDMMFPDEQIDAQTLVQNARKLVVEPKGVVRGPGGETFALKRLTGLTVEVSITRKGKRIARGFFDTKFRDKTPDEVTAYWRKDVGAVAIVAGWAPVNDPMAVGYGPPQYLVVLPLDGSTANAQSPREQAQALNVEGMKALTAKQLDDAQKKFEASTTADDSFMLAYYNLACTASLRQDRTTSIKALKVLAGSDDADAKKYLAKGLTDHDLDFIAQDPEGAKLLKRKPAKK
jgi:hypothetical protein